ncbi:hypothetical protein DFQ27_006178 [Actinomortierella ambigua]|uniref:Uncharacterized protein n=1 Tax=Actinomortierella ambigua TaxID=1343610 RepID=A0A9P6U0U6_9FUNG|nr:hypothetical protein DFQ27_006178 [Actinomortierella ambigua]
MTDVPPPNSPSTSHAASSLGVAAAPPPAITSVKTPPSDHVYQLILEQFWGDGVSKREIRCVYTTVEDANWACRDYLLRTWPKHHFTMYEEVLGPQGDASLVKIAAEIQGGDRFNCWVEKQPFKGQLDFSSKAIAKRAGKGPNAYILQRTIKDAQGGKRRSTTRGVFATRPLAREALAADQPPAEWSSNQGYLLEPGGEYASAISPSGKTAWLFIEVRPMYMSYTRLDQESLIQQQQQQQRHPQLQPGTPTGVTEGSATNPISLDGGEGKDDATPTTPTLANATTLTVTGAMSTTTSQDPFSPLIANPDEAGAHVYLVLQLKTIPFTPPILTVEAVAYELDVANQFGMGILDLFCEPLQHLNVSYDPAWREDGCLQVSIERADVEDGLTVWVEKRAVILGDHMVASESMEHPSTIFPPVGYGSSATPGGGSGANSPGGYLTPGYMQGGGGPGMDYQLISERASIQYDAPIGDSKKEPAPVDTTAGSTTLPATEAITEPMEVSTPVATPTSKKREGSMEVEDGGPGGSRPTKTAKRSLDSAAGEEHPEEGQGAVDISRRFHVIRRLNDQKTVVLRSFDELKSAKTFARVKCYAALQLATTSAESLGGGGERGGMEEADVHEEDKDEMGGGGGGVEEDACFRFRIRALAKDGSVYDDISVQDTQPDRL